MSLPPVPPRPTSQPVGPRAPPVPPLPPDLRVSQFDPPPRFASPLAAPQPHRFDPSIPENVRAISGFGWDWTDSTVDGANAG